MQETQRDRGKAQVVYIAHRGTEGRLKLSILHTEGQREGSSCLYCTQRDRGKAQVVYIAHRGTEGRLKLSILHTEGQREGSSCLYCTQRDRGKALVVYILPCKIIFCFSLSSFKKVGAM